MFTKLAVVNWSEAWGNKNKNSLNLPADFYRKRKKFQIKFAAIKSLSRYTCEATLLNLS